MRSRTELAATIRKAMKEKQIDRRRLTSLLDLHPIMVEKVLCGDVVPSRHLEKRLIEVLGIPERKLDQLASRRERQSKASMARDANRRKVA
jgi:transcriptional regulator with XRE-family HTH domain